MNHTRGVPHVAPMPAMLDRFPRPTLRWILTLGALDPAAAIAQDPVGVFAYAHRVQDGVDRSYVSTNATGTTLPGVPSLFWRCGEGSASVDPTIELAMLVDGVSSDDGTVSVQWRFDADPPSAPTTWYVAASGIALFASDGDRDRFTYRARSAAAVLMRITDDSGGVYDSRFGLDGLRDALSRLECESALGDPDAVPDDVLERIVEEIRSLPFTEPPRLLNGEDVAEEIARAFPRRLREAGIGGVVNVYVHVDERGSVGEARIQETSGWRELDNTALVIARRLRFLPAQYDDEPVAVWVSFPIRFYVR